MEKIHHKDIGVPLVGRLPAAASVAHAPRAHARAYIDSSLKRLP